MSGRLREIFARLGCFPKILIVGCVVMLAWLGPYKWLVHMREAQLGYHYRVKVHLSHKGEPIEMNYVVGCGGAGFPLHPDGTPVDALGTNPTLYAMATQDGHAVEMVGSSGMIRNFCNGETTANGRVAANWLPMIIWYDRAENLAHGVAYVTQDAYENPSSQLEFHGATVEPATPQEYRDFYARGTPNLLPDYMVGSLYRGEPALPKDVTAYKAEPWRAWPYAGTGACNGVERLPLTDSQKDMVRPYWPADHPKYWAEENRAESGLILKLYARIPPAGRPSDFPLDNAPNAWINNRKYNFSSDKERRVFILNDNMTYEDLSDFRPQVFPIDRNTKLYPIDRDLYEDKGYHFDIRIGDDKAEKGFMYCDRYGIEIGTSLGLFTNKGDWKREYMAVSRRSVSGTSIPINADEYGTWGSILFENDEYAITTTDGFIF